MRRWISWTVAGGGMSLAAMLAPHPVANCQERWSTQAALLPSPVQRALTGGVAVLRTPGSDVILVPRGTFEMGSKPIEVQLTLGMCKREPLGSRCDARFFSHEMAAHSVTLSPFWMNRTEVTVRAYRRCAEARACNPAPYEQGGIRFERDDFPVVLVTWNDARDYCKFVKQRLPTEAEWERAARGRTGRRFPWGWHYASRRANHGKFAPTASASDDSDGYDEIAPVGSFPDGRTPDGFDDLAGNVSEWTADAYEDAYEAAPVTDPHGASFGAFRVVRGGSYLHGMPWLRGAARSFRGPSNRDTTVGFRCVFDAVSR